jgi:hypothetical protein
MRWLFAVFVVSLCALLWTAIAVARHIRRNERMAESSEVTPSQAEPDDSDLRLK